LAAHQKRGGGKASMVGGIEGTMEKENEQDPMGAVQKKKGVKHKIRCKGGVKQRIH